MSEFHRMITYLYLYEENRKTRNTGFAKIEKRDSRCLVEIHMKNTGCRPSAVPVYFYARKGANTHGVLLGEINLSRGSGDFKEILDADHLGDAGFHLSEINGIYLPVSNRIMFVSQWDDLEFLRNSFTTDVPIPDTLPEKADLAAAEAVPKPVVEEDSGTSAPPPFHLVIPSSKSPVDSTEPAPIPDDTLRKEEDSSQDNSSGQIPPIFGKEIPPENSDSKSSAEEDSLEERWKYISEALPEMTPFEGDEQTRCVRMDLKDLRLLPKYYWYLGNNSFLLHGFFNYRYLLLGMTKAEDKKRWFIGIPGVFQNPERVMASLFGFPGFRSEKASDIKTGEFGYWYRYLED